MLNQLGTLDRSAHIPAHKAEVRGARQAIQENTGAGLLDPQCEQLLHLPLDNDDARCQIFYGTAHVAKFVP